MRHIKTLFLFAVSLFITGCNNSNKKIIIHTDNAPAAVGPYEQAVVINNMIYCSGQIGLDPTTNMLVEGGIEPQTHQVFANIKAVLEAASSCLDNVIKTTVFLTNLEDFSKVNEIYSTYFTEGSYPARSCVEVSELPKNALVEIEVVAYK